MEDYSFLNEEEEAEKAELDEKDMESLKKTAKKIDDNDEIEDPEDKTSADAEKDDEPDSGSSDSAVESDAPAALDEDEEFNDEFNEDFLNEGCCGGSKKNEEDNNNNNDPVTGENLGEDSDMKALLAEEPEDDGLDGLGEEVKDGEEVEEDTEGADKKGKKKCTCGKKDCPECGGSSKNEEVEDSDFLNEDIDYRRNTRKIVVKTKQQKFDALVLETIFKLARKNNDTMYVQYSKHLALTKAFREKLRNKYLSKARTIAKKIATSTKK